MFYNFILTIFLLITFGFADKAPKIKSNPKDVVAIADFPFGGDNDIKGNVVFSAKQGKHIQVHVDMVGFPNEGGPFVYHIHEHSVPENGNCEAVGLHLNPFMAPENCTSEKSDAYCQIGDLSGKHGAINSTCFELKYTDPYLSLNPKSKSYIGNKAVVFHFANLTKIACADIEIANDLRLQSLIEEYIQTDDKLQLKELRTPLEPNYKFNQIEALSMEMYESDEDEVTKEDDESGGFQTKKQQVLLAPKQLLNKTKNKIDDSDLKDMAKKYKFGKNWRKHGNDKNQLKNISNVTIHGISSDCENKVGKILNSKFDSFIFSLLTAITLFI
ncbi:unnamed protein product [Candida verbasci]|uniref:superoxide dismutase n=1 Tax=Candida verbasci TaxID=1227364 RepID=A0A9W4XFK1_9ASCO|nr:unnamed protein product [Candida verbasci]